MAKVYDRPVWQLLIEYANQTLDENRCLFIVPRPLNGSHQIIR